MRSLSLGQIAIVVALLLMLVLAIVGIAMAWTASNGVEDVAMDENGWIALGLGALFSLLVGCGLMSLVFFSSRHGYDDAADPFRRRDPEK